MLRTTPRDDDRIRNEIQAARDEVAADRRNAGERSTACRFVPAGGPPLPKVVEKSREGLLARTEGHRIGVTPGFVGKGCDVQSAERHEGPALDSDPPADMRGGRW